MIDYPRGRWRSLTLAWRGTVLPRTLPWALALTALAVVIKLATQQHLITLEVPPLAHNLIGVALGLLLVFRTNASYDRYWEGRKQWGGIVNSSRNLVRAGASYLTPNAAAAELARLVQAFPLALKQHLRGLQTYEELDALLPAPLRASLAGVNAPLRITRAMSQLIGQHHSAGTLPPEAARALETYVANLVDHQGACERILRTPVPFAYVVHIRQLLLFYLISLPFVVVPTLGWIGPVAVAFITLGLMGIEEIGVEIEEPFGTDPNDLPLEAMCATIGRDAQALIA